MFSLTSSKKGLLARKALFFFFTACLVMGMAVFSGCSTDDEDTGNLVGTWEYVYHDPTGTYPDSTTIINITGETVVYTGSYEATIANDPDFESSYGVLILQFTKYADWGDESPSETHDNVGKYGAMYWKDLTSSKVSLADAYIGYDHTMFGTLSEAESAFTNDKVGDYIDWGITSPYNKK
jgi:hypothetical protein